MIRDRGEGKKREVVQRGRSQEEEREGSERESLVEEGSEGG